MQQTILDRIANLELAALRMEGAVYALHDIIAQTLAQTPEAEVKRIFGALKEHAQQLDQSLGNDRIVGYRDELASIEREIDHARREPGGIFARLRRL